MSMGSKEDATGFLSIVGNLESGFAGGLLVLNQTGRPLEFHCTSAVKPTRAQEILYGPTLYPYLFGEQIGQTLYKKCKSAMESVFVDHPACHPMREGIKAALLLYVGSRQASEATASASGRHEPTKQAMDSSEHSSAISVVNVGDENDPRSQALDSRHWSRFPFRDEELGYCQEYEQDKQTGTATAERLTSVIELDEPFRRVKAALEETLGSARAA